MNPDIAQSYRERRDRLMELVRLKTERERFDWDIQARPEQRLPPGDWPVWAFIAARGAGKTRAGSEATRKFARENRFVNVVGATFEAVRNIQIEGPAGILSVCPNDERPTFFPARRTLEWPSGCRSLLQSADEPDRLRGTQCEKLWADELAAWRNPKEAWDMLLLGLRLGRNPQAIVTTTPRPTRMLKELLANKTTVVTRATTYDNAKNLSPFFYSQVITRYEGTRLGRQELLGELLEDVEGALWTQELIDRGRLVEVPKTVNLVRTVIPVDPAVSFGDGSNKTGIVPVAMDDRRPTHFYVLEDATDTYSPEQWARKAIQLYYAYGADRVVAEANQGGTLIEAALRNADENVAYRAVHASKGKIARAEPIAALYEQGRVHHIGAFPELEDQQTTYTQGASPSPDRLDALVWGLTELSENTGGELGLVSLIKRIASGALDMITLKPRATITVAAQENSGEQAPQIPGRAPEWRPEPREACAVCGSLLTVQIAGSLHCNACGSDVRKDSITTPPAQAQCCDSPLIRPVSGMLRCANCGRQDWPQGAVPLVSTGYSRRDFPKGKGQDSYSTSPRSIERK